MVASAIEIETRAFLSGGGNTNELEGADADAGDAAVQCLFTIFDASSYVV